MRDRGYPGVAWRFLEMFFEKKVSKIFGGFKNMLYLCTRFHF
jgi:hypothetical protein